MTSQAVRPPATQIWLGARHVKVAAVAALAAVGVLAGAAPADPPLPMNARLAQADGACVAIEMAAAHGYLDDTQRRVVLRALTGALNPRQELFPLSFAEFSRKCDQVRGSSHRRVSQDDWRGAELHVECHADDTPASYTDPVTSSGASRGQHRASMRDPRA